MGQIVQAYKQAQQTWIWKKPGKTHIKLKELFLSEKSVFHQIMQPSETETSLKHAGVVMVSYGFLVFLRRLKGSSRSSVCLHVFTGWLWNLQTLGSLNSQNSCWTFDSLSTGSLSLFHRHKDTVISFFDSLKEALRGFTTVYLPGCFIVIANKQAWVWFYVLV